MNIIIFSKNRAAQLDLFLSSMAHHFPESCGLRPTVIYKAEFVNDMGHETDDYINGYNICRGYHQWVDFVYENNFREQILSLIDNHKRCTMFAVDDIVWKGHFSLKDREYTDFIRARDRICLSLRLWPGISWSYMLNMKADRPPFIRKYVWRADRGRADWCYPMSLDCNIYRTEDILPILKKINFMGPNDLEGMLCKNKIRKPLMQCYDDSKVLNIPANRVQNVALKNRDAGGNPLELNRKFLEGGRLAYEQFIGYKNNAVHMPMELEWR